MKKIIISTDCALTSFHDPDDALALLYLFTSECVAVQAVITTYGNASETVVFESVRSLLDVTGFACEIIRGPKNRHDSDCESTNFLRSINQQEYSLASTAPLTALRCLSERQLGAFQQVYVMGGALGCRGNRLPFYRAEFNISKDTDAARDTFHARSVNCVPLDSTRKIALDSRFLRNVRRQWPRIGRQVSRWNLLNRVLFLGKGANPHDLVLVLAITNPEFFTKRITGIKLNDGQTREDPESYPQHQVFFVTAPDPIVRFFGDWSEGLQGRGNRRGALIEKPRLR